MAIASNVYTGPYTANGTQTAFAFDFTAVSASDVSVQVDGASISSNLYVVSISDAGTGTVTFSVPPASGASVLLLLTPDFSQETVYENEGAYKLSTVNATNRRAATRANYLNAVAKRSLRVPVGESLSELPNAAGRAGKVLGFDLFGSASLLALTGAVVTDAALVYFTQSGTGAVARTVQDRLRDTVNVKDFGAKGDYATDDTAAIQAAINTGKSILFPPGNYLANNLTGSTTGQRFYAQGDVTIYKNGNGVLLSHSGNYIELNGLQFVGSGYTGDNINLTGTHPRILWCSSTGTPGRALKATGNQVQIYGTCGSYSTTDTTASGYDIEIGISGTSTLYHELVGIYSSQRTGGILLIDTGSHTIHGGQFGKLTIQSGTSPTGVNGGKTMSARILGDVSVGISNSTFVNNQFGAITFTIQSGITNVYVINNVEENGFSLVNNSGSINHFIVRNSYVSGVAGVLYGDDTSLARLFYTPSTGAGGWSQQWTVPNTKTIGVQQTDGSAGTYLQCNGSNVGTLNLGASTAFGQINAGANGLYTIISGTNITQHYYGGLRPATDNTFNCGTATQRWANVYSTTITAITVSASTVKTTSVTVSGLPAAATAGAGARTFVSDSTVAASGNFGAVVAGGGANAVPVFSDGTNWRIG